jgi:adenylate cyclase
MTGRRLAAILAADIVGYSRMIGADEAGTLSKMSALRREIIDPLVAEHDGRIFKTTGDGLLAEFPSTVQALRCAIVVQERVRGGELQLRIGVHQGDVVVEGDDLLGDGVNVAARLEALAEPGGICISGRVREDAAGKLALEVEDLGEPELKNITQRHRVFRVRLGEPERPALPLPDKPSLAVLPFANMSGDPEQEYFADGMVEDITTALSRIGGLFVIARNSSFTYKGRAVDVKQVGRELGVRYVVEGSVRKVGGRVRITCQLVNAATGAHVWAEKFDSALDDVFELQDRVTESVAGAVEPTLRNAEIARALNKPTENLDAYDFYLRALAQFDLFTSESREEALRLLRRAIALDPRFARALALVAWSVCFKVIFGETTLGSPETAEAVAMSRTALAAASDDPTALRQAGHALTYLSGDRDVGRVAVDRALMLNPNSAQVLMSSGFFHIFAGNWSKARDEFERAIRLSPIDPDLRFTLMGLAHSMIELGEVSAAEEAARKAVAAGSGRPYGITTLVQALVLLGRLGEARQFAGRLLQVRPDYTIAAYRLGNRLYPPDCVERACDALRAAGIPE